RLCAQWPGSNVDCPVFNSREAHSAGFDAAGLVGIERPNNLGLLHVAQSAPASGITSTRSLGRVPICSSTSHRSAAETGGTEAGRRGRAEVELTCAADRSIVQFRNVDC